MPAKEDAAEYRALAADCREMAAKAHDPKNKEAWLRLAGDWLVMAEEAERQP